MYIYIIGTIVAVAMSSFAKILVMYILIYVTVLWFKILFSYGTHRGFGNLSILCKHKAKKKKNENLPVAVI